jgi:hypothetical protein
MRMTQLLSGWRNQELVAAFGRAQLLKNTDCTYELRGGSDDDRAQAREWISLFFHEAVIRERGTFGSAVPERGCVLRHYPQPVAQEP